MLISYKEWKEQTACTGKPRSKQFKEVDEAYEIYFRDRNIPNLNVLINKLLAWVEEKQKAKREIWRDSCRNNRKAVENLVKELAKRRYREQQLRDLLAPEPKIEVRLDRGEIRQEKDADNKWHTLWIQQDEHSCGPACIRIVANLVNNQNIGEKYIKDRVVEAEKKRGPTPYEQPVGPGEHNWHQIGTWFVPAVLAEIRPKIVARFVANAQDLVNATKKKPAIGVVVWTQGGAPGASHYVVVAGKLKKNGNMLVLDPFFGVQEVGINNNQLGEYQPQINGLTVARANWVAWVCRVR